MRPEMKFQPFIKETLFTLLFIAGEIIEISFRGSSEKNSLLSKDVSFHMISFRPMFTWYFITRNKNSFLSK